MTHKQINQKISDYMRFNQYSDSQIILLLLAKQKVKIIKEAK